MEAVEVLVQAQHIGGKEAGSAAPKPASLASAFSRADHFEKQQMQKLVSGEGH